MPLFLFSVLYMITQLGKIKEFFHFMVALTSFSQVGQCYKQNESGCVTHLKFTWLEIVDHRGFLHLYISLVT